MKKSIIKTTATLALGMMIGSATLAAAAPSTVEAVLTKFKIIVNGQETQLKNTPLVVNGTTYLPVREVAELLNTDLNYDGNNKKIELSSKKDNATTSQPVKSDSKKDDIKIIYPGEEFNLGNTTLKLNSVTYSTHVPYEPGGVAGFVSSSGEKFALINFDVYTTSEPINGFTWSANNFVSNITVNNKVLQRGSSTGTSMKIQPREKKTVEVFISIPDNMEASTVQFNEPGNLSSAVVVTL
ncbi:hypothetical protein PMSD_14985 [Paenibacillus macquariensis subsp. defensor]|nr:hypothetical protein PMSD_14985 [Paenibacillus macquariensis subsp. defensor]